MRRVAQAANFRHAVYGPAELFYGEMYSSQEVDCRATLARPGTRDPYSGCVGSHLEQYDLYDFMLFSLPDNDHYSHRHGPDATVTSIARADRYLEQLVQAGGGIESFLADHAVILMADHAQIAVEESIPLVEALSDWRVLQPNDPDPAAAEIAVSPGGRSGMLYLLGDERSRERSLRRLVRRAGALKGVDLVAWRDGAEACVRTARGELRFAPGSAVRDLRGGAWDVDGARAVLDATLDGGEFDSRAYPDALGRLWAALGCDGAGDVLLSAERGYEFVDWGGADHVGGGSHGSLRRGDSLGPLAFVNCGPDLERDAPVRRQWSIADVAEVVLGHFGARP